VMHSYKCLSFRHVINDTLEMDIACGIGIFMSSQDNIMHIKQHSCCVRVRSKICFWRLLIIYQWAVYHVKEVLS
jgi:hypothetical protein